ncbi:putative redox-active protein [Oxobacter pfennigii]|uniref:Putative redox-active protein n=1 Tax=Oxobacter pfennigii TaxID=36849 RepID=A0A0N8NTV5_9CLOT|nr:C-GCAxxG-C-C family (seleno)protein [Oxobacter pfennigii]KPU45888.1 putative redox-active protein [Oxobacter pfennigii]
MLKEMVNKYYDKSYDLNCAETLLYAANEEYDLNMDKKALKIAAGFGGGMAVEGDCGALTGAIMALGVMFVEKQAHESDRIKTLTKEMIQKFNEKLKSVNCKELKSMYRNDEIRCTDIVYAAAEALDEIVSRERK